VYNLPRRNGDLTGEKPVWKIANARRAVIGASNRQVVLTLNATVYIQPQADLGRKYQDLMAWRTWLRDSLIDGVTLNGTDAVAQASVTSTSIGTDKWQEADYLTITATIEISSVEGIATSA